MHRFLANYYRYIIGKTKAVANKLSIFNFNELKKAVKSYIIAAEDTEYIVILFSRNV